MYITLLAPPGLFQLNFYNEKVVVFIQQPAKWCIII